MRLLVFFYFLVLSSNCFAWDCIDNLRSFPLDKTPIELEQHQGEKIDAHLKKASEIILGKVISGKVGEDNISFEMYVVHSFKGNKKNIVKITNPTNDYLTRKLSLNDNYLIFLYGSNVVDFCSISTSLGDGEISIEILKKLLEEPDRFGVLQKQILNKVLDYAP